MHDLSTLGCPSYQHHELEIGGIRTSVYEAGSGPTLVLIHGGNAGGASSFFAVMEQLAGKWRVIAPDIPGCGDSQIPDFSAKDPSGYLGWMSALMDWASPGRPCVLAGSSIGGALSLHWSIRNPDRIEKLLLINSAGIIPFQPPGGFLLTFLLFVLMPTPFTLWLMSLASRARVWRDAAVDSFVLDMFAKMKRKGGRKFLSLLQCFSVPPKADQLKAISPKIRLIWGEQDPVIPLRKVTKARGLEPAKIHRIAKASHYPFMDNPEGFLKAFDEGIQARTPQGPGHSR